MLAKKAHAMREYWQRGSEMLNTETLGSGVIETAELKHSKRWLDLDLYILRMAVMVHETGGQLMAGLLFPVGL